MHGEIVDRRYGVRRHYEGLLSCLCPSGRFKVRRSCVRRYMNAEREC
jgi:hypothetical protein